MSTWTIVEERTATRARRKVDRAQGEAFEALWEALSELLAIVPAAKILCHPDARNLVANRLAKARAALVLANKVRGK